jgi:hypothetical protein
VQDGVIRVYSYKEDIFEDIAFGPTNRDFTANAIVWDVLKSARVHPQKFDSREEERIFKVKTKANGDCFFLPKRTCKTRPFKLFIQPQEWIQL